MRSLRYSVLTLLTLMFVSPLLFMLSTWFKDRAEAGRTPPTWIPQHPTVEAYTHILHASDTPVLQWFFNSMIAASCNAFLVVTTASLAAYALARMEFKGRRVVFALIVATLFVPPVILVIPNYEIVGQLRWLDSLIAVIVPTAANAFGVFFLRQFFLSLPPELEESAFLDGANRFQIFYKVVRPLAKPALATLALLAFLTNWNDFLWPVYVLFDPGVQTLQAGLSTLQSANNVRYDLLMAGGGHRERARPAGLLVRAAFRDRGGLTVRPEGMSAAPLSRRTFLVGLTASAFGTAACSGRSPAHPRADKDSTIFDLSFREQLRFRPVHIADPGFLVSELSEVGPVSDLRRGPVGLPAPYAAVEVDVRGGDGLVVAGLAGEDDSRVVGTWDRGQGRVTIEVRVDGRTRVVRRRKVGLAGATTLAFALCENQVTLLARTGRTWAPLLTERGKVAALVDLRRPETLSGLRPLWGVREGTGTVDIGGVRAGLFGMTGLRDPHVVQYSDGRPYVRDGRVYLTWTCAGLGFFQQAHWGVFSMSLDQPHDLQQVAHVFTERDGLVVGDHAGQIVRDEEHDRWLLANSAWGDFDFDGVHVRHATTQDDVLTGVHVLRTERTPLPTRVSSWDPGMTRIDGRWLVSFVESPSQQPFDFHPALAGGPAGAEWPDKLEPVGADTTLHQCEGPLLEHVQGAWWLLASDGKDRDYPVYDLQLRRVGRLDAPYPSNIPHPQIISLPDGGHLLVTFDGKQFHPKVMGYGGHGDVIVMRA